MDIEGAFLYQNSLCFTSRKRNPNLRVQPATTTFFSSKGKKKWLQEKSFKGLGNLHSTKTRNIFTKIHEKNSICLDIWGFCFLSLLFLLLFVCFLGITWIRRFLCPLFLCMLPCQTYRLMLILFLSSPACALLGTKIFMRQCDASGSLQMWQHLLNTVL